MQNQHLMEGLEEFFQASYPELSQPTLVNIGTSSPIENTSDVCASGSSGNLLLKFIVVGGVIFLVYCLANNYNKVNKQQLNNKRFKQ